MSSAKKATTLPRTVPAANGSLHRHGSALPAVAGRRLDCSNADFERRCLVMLGRIQENPFTDSALVALLCDAVRCVREYNDAMSKQSQDLVDALKTQNERDHL